ncbi:tetratricopeptide repeat protein [Coraliomargarita sp. SDUM461004]|uniref:Tetratricopeptide repeat protein n=1 Tax=Thalassobacterium sedimentorum TaxID=3041258 RepID=A0ABU1AER7_9BACT|nr:tetratricopeptide repeat protein [Coraliomargarita sp. SDUM461004]MDQ8193154.1 tetratricopeptide repeat protein [Coraliomargarita sp. SDUM461004]
MFFRAVILALCLHSTCLLNAAASTERIEFYYGIAEGNYLIGDLKGAERGVEQMLRLDTNYLPALTLKARVMLDQNKSAAALVAAERAIALQPAKLEYTLLKALVLGQMQRRDEASVLIQQVLDNAPPTSDDARVANQLLGLIRMAEGEWDQAAAAFNNIYLADPGTASTSLRLSSEAYLEKARTEMQAGAHDAAIAAIDQAIAVYQNKTGQEALQQRTALRLMRARLLTQLGRFDSAIKDLQVLSGQQPENYEALITLASLYASVERWDSLETVIEPIAQRPELRDVALYFEGRSALAKNRVGTARAKFEAGIDALPKDADQLRRSLYFYRGICLDRLNRRTEAQNSILDAIDAGFRPETSEEAVIASRSLLRADRASEAIPLLEAITLNRIEPGAAIWAMLGRAHIATETFPLALSALNESLSIDPNQAEIRALRGSLLRKIGDLEGALVDYNAARQLAPQDPSIAYASGLVYLQIGQLTEAEKNLAFAAQALPDNAGLQLLHALLAYGRGDVSRARSSLQTYQQQITQQQNPSASYLDYLLRQHDHRNLPELDTDEVSQYYLGNFTRKQALDASGRANSPEQARQQMCATAFWLAQFEKLNDQVKAYRELLAIAVEIGNPDLIEYQLAKWQLEQLQ